MELARQLEALGLHGVGEVHRNLTPAVLYEEAIRRGEGRVAAGGALVVKTGTYTGRAANDKFIVEEPGSSAQINWGDVNRPFAPERFDALWGRVLAYFENREVFECCGADGNVISACSQQQSVCTDCRVA